MRCECVEVEEGIEGINGNGEKIQTITLILPLMYITHRILELFPGPYFHNWPLILLTIDLFTFLCPFPMLSMGFVTPLFHLCNQVSHQGLMYSASDPSCLLPICFLPSGIPLLSPNILGLMLRSNSPSTWGMDIRENTNGLAKINDI